MAMTPDGCSSCGGTYFYISNHKCVACLLAFGRSRTRRRAEICMRGRAGAAQGFILFGSVNHKILLHLDRNGPCSHGEIRAAVGSNPATFIGRLVEHGFIESVGEIRDSRNLPCSVYDIKGRSERLPRIKRLTRKEVYANYRKRRQVRVASVFEFRGRINLNERKAA